MGAKESSTPQIQQFWESTHTNLADVPGSPILVKSTLRPDFFAELYTQQIGSADKELQAAIFRERRIGNQNIVGLHDFQVKKGLFNCSTCQSTFYDIVIERIPYRLSSFTNLSSTQMIYIFHESLNGFMTLSQYSKICYPSIDMIGIKQNGEVKVWINPNWSDNSYRKAPSQKSSILALWNSIKLCGDSRNVQNVSRTIYSFDNYGFQFENVTRMLREKYWSEVFEGKMRFETRVKNFGINLMKTSRNSGSAFARPRAYSEQLKRSTYADQCQFSFKNNDFIKDGEPTSKPVSVLFFQQAKHPVQSPQVSNVSFHTKNNQTEIPLNKSRFISKSTDKNKNNIQKPQTVVFFTKKIIQSPPRKIKDSVVFSPTIRSQIKKKIQVVKGVPITNHKNNKINFSYQNSQYYPDIHKITQKFNQKNINSSPIQQINLQNKPQQIQQSPNRKILFQPVFHSYPSPHPFPQPQPQQNTFRTIQPFQLQINLQNLMNMQQVNSQRNSNSTTQMTNKQQPKSDRPTMQQQSQYKPVQSMQLQQTPFSPKKNNTQSLDELSNSRKVAEQFKYYLRSAERQKQKQQQQQQILVNDQEETQDLERQDNYENEAQKGKYIYQYNTLSIPERWEEEQSLSQTNI